MKRCRIRAISLWSEKWLCAKMCPNGIIGTPFNREILSIWIVDKIGKVLYCYSSDLYSNTYRMYRGRNSYLQLKQDENIISLGSEAERTR
jgi:hypothetical protein